MWKTASRCASPARAKAFIRFSTPIASAESGAADLDGKELSPDAPLEVPLFRASFEEGDDLSAFSIDLSPYGKDDTAARGTTAPLAFPVQWGGTYNIVLSGDEANGFTASLAA